LCPNNRWIFSNQLRHKIHIYLFSLVYSDGLSGCWGTSSWLLNGWCVVTGGLSVWILSGCWIFNGCWGTSCWIFNGWFVEVTTYCCPRAGTYSARGLGIAESIWEHKTRKRNQLVEEGSKTTRH
jgi:hypothetical protein